jgi:hypothetical protein
MLVRPGFWGCRGRRRRARPVITLQEAMNMMMRTWRSLIEGMRRWQAGGGSHQPLGFPVFRRGPRHPSFLTRPCRRFGLLHLVDSGTKAPSYQKVVCVCFCVAFSVCCLSHDEPLVSFWARYIGGDV